METMWWENQLRDKEDRAVIKLHDESGKFIKSVIVPTEYYPLNGKHEVFTYQNTEAVTDKEILNLFDKVKYEIGYCYQNTFKLCEILQAHGYPARPYVGWLFTNGTQPPVHHCWCVLGNSVLDLADDFTVMLSGANGKYFKTAKSIEESRELIASFHENAMNVENHLRCHAVGQATPFLLYVGSECDPNYGRTIYQRLMDKYPDHECQRNCDGEGYNATQRIMENRGLMK